MTDLNSKYSTDSYILAACYIDVYSITACYEAPRIYQEVFKTFLDIYQGRCRAQLLCSVWSQLKLIQPRPAQWTRPNPMHHHRWFLRSCGSNWWWDFMHIDIKIGGVKSTILEPSLNTSWELFCKFANYSKR